MQFCSPARSLWRVSVARWVCACLLTWSAHARAQDAAEESKLAAARQLGQAGVELYMNGDTAGALEKLQRAYSVYQAPSLGLWYGRALERSGHLVEASERYRQVSVVELRGDATAAFRQAKTDAKQALDAVLPRLPQLTIEIPGIDVARLHVTLDGADLPVALLGVPIPANPGAHLLRGALGSQSCEQSLQLEEGAPLVATLTFPPEPIAPPEPTRSKSGLQPVSLEKTGDLPRSQLFKVLQSLRPEINACGRGRPGGFVASLIVRGSTGRVESKKIKFDERFVQQLVPSGAVTRERLAGFYESCLLRVLDSARFPPFQKPLLEIEYPFRFAPTPPTQHADSERATNAMR